MMIFEIYTFWKILLWSVTIVLMIASFACLIRKEHFGAIFFGALAMCWFMASLLMPVIVGEPPRPSDPPVKEFIYEHFRPDPYYARAWLETHCDGACTVDDLKKDGPQLLADYYEWLETKEAPK